MWSAGGYELILVLFVFTVFVVSLLLLLQIYTLCFLRSSAAGTPQMEEEAAAAAASRANCCGLDDLTVAASLPLFSGRPGGRSTEAADCVVCLSELEDDGDGRVLPLCGHVFHAGCIGRWLASHSTRCPICRTPVRSDPADPPAAAGASLRAAAPPEEVGGVGGDGGPGDLFAARGLMIPGEEHHLPLLLFY